MIEELAVALAAAPSEVLRSVGRLLDLVAGHGERRERPEELLLRSGVGEAAHRCAVADTTGIEPDDVELGLDGRGENVPRVVADERQHRVARTTVVDEDRANAMRRVAGRHPGEGQGDVATAGAVVVEWTLAVAHCRPSSQSTQWRSGTTGRR